MKEGVSAAETIGVLAGGLDTFGVTVCGESSRLGPDETDTGVRVGLSDKMGASEDMVGLREALGVTAEDANGLWEGCCGEGEFEDTEGNANKVSTPEGDELIVVFGVTEGSLIVGEDGVGKSDGEGSALIDGDCEVTEDGLGLVEALTDAEGIVDIDGVDESGIESVGERYGLSEALGDATGSFELDATGAVDAKGSEFSDDDADGDVMGVVELEAGISGEADDVNDDGSTGIFELDGELLDKTCGGNDRDAVTEGLRLSDELATAEVVIDALGEGKTVSVCETLGGRDLLGVELGCGDLFGEGLGKDDLPGDGGALGFVDALGVAEGVTEDGAEGVGDAEADGSRVGVAV